MSNGNGESGVEHKRVTVVHLTYDHETCLVTFTTKDVPVALVQMMVDEVRRQLEIMRRQAAALEFQQQQLQVRADQVIAEAVRRGRS